MLTKWPALANLISLVNRRLRISAVSIIGVIFIFYFTFHYSLFNFDDNIKNTTPNQVVVVDKSTQIATHYRHLLDTYPDGEFQKFSFKKKCTSYFNELYKVDPDWEVINRKEQDKYTKDIFNKDEFIRNKINDFKKNNEDKEPTEDDLSMFKLQFLKAHGETTYSQQIMTDAMTHLRVYGKCFLQDDKSSLLEWFDSSNQDDEKELADGRCYDIELRLFPWLTKTLPEFTRWDGTKVFGIPDMSKYIDAPSKDEKEKEKEDIVKRTITKSCFMNDWRSSLNGKGIVLSIDDNFEKDVLGLIRLLRALGNTLPIQFIHKGDLSVKAQENIIKEGRTSKIRVPFEIYDEIKQDIPNDFPKQEIWFVNTKLSIKDEYRSRFEKFSNKLLAYLFNSFDETILMDADAVPLINPADFFKTNAYKRTNTIFFKDRTTHDRVAGHDSDYFRNLMPNDIDQALFGIPLMTNKTLNNRYMKHHYSHVMEAGIVVIKRSTHFIGMLTTIQLNFWHSTTSRVWGDKELFWLGQAVGGDENYEFNKFDAVSAGELTPRKLRNGLISNELCSTHPAHLNGDDEFTLLWINSGTRFCKKTGSWKDDISRDIFKDRFKTEDDLKEYYNSAIKISSVLVPPEGSNRVSNSLKEPDFAWLIKKECENYLWCAYDVIGGSTDPKDQGRVINYNNTMTSKNEYLGRIWLDQKLDNLKDFVL